MTGAGGRVVAAKGVGVIGGTGVVGFLMLIGTTGVGSGMTGTEPVGFFISTAAGTDAGAGEGAVAAADGGGTRGVVFFLSAKSAEPGNCMGVIGPDSLSFRVAGLAHGAEGIEPEGGLAAPRKLGRTAVFVLVGTKGVVTGTEPVGGFMPTGASMTLGITFVGGKGVGACVTAIGATTGAGVGAGVTGGCGITAVEARTGGLGAGGVTLTGADGAGGTTAVEAMTGGGVATGGGKVGDVATGGGRIGAAITGAGVGAGGMAVAEATTGGLGKGAVTIGGGRFGATLTGVFGVGGSVVTGGGNVGAGAPIAVGAGGVTAGRVIKGNAVVTGGGGRLDALVPGSFGAGMTAATGGANAGGLGTGGGAVTGEGTVGAALMGGGTLIGGGVGGARITEGLTMGAVTLTGGGRLGAALAGIGAGTAGAGESGSTLAGAAGTGGGGGVFTEGIGGGTALFTGGGVVSIGSVTAPGLPGAGGRSETRRETVGFLARTMSGAISVGRPKAGLTPDCEGEGIGGGVASVGCGGNGAGEVEPANADGMGGATILGGRDGGPPGAGALATEGKGCVAGRAGGLEPWGTGCKSSGCPTLLVWTKTLAWGFATMTRGGGATIRPDAVARSAAGVMLGGTGVGAGDIGMAARGGSAGGAPIVPRVTFPDGGFWGKRGVVFALGGAPVIGGAAERGGGGVKLVVDGLEILGIGLVTAVDQAGGTFVTGAGSSWPEVFIGSVVAAEIFGRGVALILEDAGLRGRGGKLMRSVSRLGAFGSVPSGVAESAIWVLFIVISENVQWRNSQS